MGVLARKRKARAMSDEACPIAQPVKADQAATIARVLQGRRVAVVGASDNPNRPAHYVPEYLIEHGYEVIPVNPTYERVFGLRCYAKLADVPGPIDLVNVFRRSEFCAEVAREAVAAGAKGIWLQAGITSAEARQIAQVAGIDYVEDRCLMVEHRRHQKA